jgi:hypothetical protein
MTSVVMKIFLERNMRKGKILARENKKTSRHLKIMKNPYLRTKPQTPKTKDQRLKTKDQPPKTKDQKK